MNIIRGSNPSVVFELPFQSSRVTDLYVFFMQKESVYLDEYNTKFTKAYKDCKLEGVKLIIPLTSDETAILDRRRPLGVQVECYCGVSKLVSKVLEMAVDDFGVSPAVNNSLDGSVKMVNPYLLDFGVIHEVEVPVPGQGTSNHDELNNRDLPDQHRIAAVTGLSDILDKLVDAVPEGTFTDEEMQEMLGHITEGDLTKEDIQDIVEEPNVTTDPTRGEIDALWKQIVVEGKEPEHKNNSIDNTWKDVMNGGEG